ncbi:prolyl aminopeptidase [Pacificimonas flava]|uniref:Proline iminopeptidase n=1 Tax=Pacificimonas flava TaxID=1234595 RepID=A0A219B920_9SPHN|nr:prolyl aminopeptidase [Pacificimonas flava]
MRTLYPPIQPYETGMLDVGDGHSVYWERCGTKGAKPAVFLHSGPGGTASEDHRRQWNPDKYDIMLFDQRGCGRSTPHASTEANTTWHLVADIEKLRALMGVERWQVFGGSWGSTLSLAYAEAHPERVTELVLRGIFTFREEEIDWFYRSGVPKMFPDAYEKFLAPIPQDRRGEDPLEVYHDLLTSDDKETQLAAAQAFALWEGTVVKLLPDADVTETFSGGHFALAFSRIEHHYMRHRGWLREGQLLTEARKIADIPGVIVHGRYDMPCPLKNAWDLKAAWPKGDLKIVEGAGHSYDEPGILSELVTATDRFAAG